MKLRRYQEKAIEEVERNWEEGNRKTLLSMATGCHAVGEELLMTDGTIEKVEDIQVGDQLIGMDGKPRNVIVKHEGERDIYKIDPIKGEPFYVTDNHTLTLVKTTQKKNSKHKCRRGGKLVDIRVDEYLEKSNNFKHLHKLFRSEAIEFNVESELTIDPYFLGVLLGDGDLKNAISITNSDPEIIEKIERQCDKYLMSYRTEPAGNSKTYIFKSHELGCKGGKLHNELKDLGLRGTLSNTKFIPYEYKTAPIKDRLEILAGLLDTDGSLTCNSFDYVSASERLANDVAFIARSLGLAAYVSKQVKGIKGIDFKGEYYRVTISGHTDKIPTRVKRKQARPRKMNKDVLRTGFEVEYSHRGQYVGFTVDEDNRYLLSDFTVTHNCGKTIVFSKIIEERVKQGDRCLILAHREELLNQAKDKLKKATGLESVLEKAQDTARGRFERVTVGSVQTLANDRRLARFPKDYYDTVIVDEAHHILSDSYLKVMDHFDKSKVLGVTATPDRGDMKNLGQFFDSLAYEYSIANGIRDGYLSPIKALSVPLEIDLGSIKSVAGDYSQGDVGHALDPYLEAIADEMANYCRDKKTIVFLPLIETSKKFTSLLNERGFKAEEINGQSTDRQEILERFEKGETNVLCNAMLLTEGFDEPSIDCVVVLRPTKVRSLYTQMVGRGLRPSPGKDSLLLLDFLWMTDKHDLVRPAGLFTDDTDVMQRTSKKLEEGAREMDLEDLTEEAEQDAIADRERSLRETLEANRKKKKRLVDPLQYAFSVMDKDLANYVPNFGWEKEAPTTKQKKWLEKNNLDPSTIKTKGEATKIINVMRKRQEMGMSTPKQIRLLEGRGFVHVGEWTKEEASQIIGKLAQNKWQYIPGVSPKAYKPERLIG